MSGDAVAHTYFTFHVFFSAVAYLRQLAALRVMHIFTVKKFRAESFLVYSEGLHCLRILFALQKGALKEALARCLHQVAYIGKLRILAIYCKNTDLRVRKTYWWQKP